MHLTDLALNAFDAAAAQHHPQISTSGGLCLLCKLCADHGIPHTCITQPGPIDTVLMEVPRDLLEPMLQALATHPARPLTDANERRGVDRTWCVCGCTRKGGSHA